MTALDRFNALPQDAKDAILEKHRDWNVDCIEWWEGVYEQFTEDMKEKGIYVHRMYFSGFWSQGDGACFEGSVSDWKLFLASLFAGDELQRAIETYDKADEFNLSWSQRDNYYCHENTLSFDFSCYYDNPWEGEGGLREAAQKALNAQYEPRSEAINEIAVEAIKNHCRRLYKNLEEEHDYLTSDETVLDSLNANDKLDEIIDEYEEENDPGDGPDETEREAADSQVSQSQQGHQERPELCAPR